MLCVASVLINPLFVYVEVGPEVSTELYWEILEETWGSQEWDQKPGLA